MAVHISKLVFYIGEMHIDSSSKYFPLANFFPIVLKVRNISNFIFLNAALVFQKNFIEKSLKEKKNLKGIRPFIY